MSVDLFSTLFENVEMQRGDSIEEGKLKKCINLEDCVEKVDCNTKNKIWAWAFFFSWKIWLSVELDHFKAWEGRSSNMTRWIELLVR
jgi:hypothetical protein